MNRTALRRLGAISTAAVLAIALSGCGIFGGKGGPKTPTVGNRVPILSRIEAGTRVDPSPYSFGGVYFGADVPQLKYRPDEMKIVIRLSQCARNDNGKILWQLAHECLHLLSPVRLWTTMLEEGLACWYQLRWTQICPQLFTENFLSPETAFGGRTHKYFEAYSMVDEILKHDQDSIKRIRTTQPIISKITPSQLVSEITRLDVPTAKKLSSRFSKKH